MRRPSHLGHELKSPPLARMIKEVQTNLAKKHASSRGWSGAAIAAALMLAACSTSHQVPSQSRSPLAQESPKVEYSDEDAAKELDFSNAPTQRIRSRRRSVQHKSMPLHGAQTQPCAFEDCDISDEDDPLWSTVSRQR